MAQHTSQRTGAAGDALNRRKAGHLEACLDSDVDLGRNSFAPYKLRYSALPEIALEDVSLETTFAGRPISAPLIISSMTGGVGAEFERINHNLATAAQALRIPLGLGSMKVMLRHPHAAPSFQVRDVAPDVPLIANLGLVSFNYGLNLSDVERLIEDVRPDVFALHLNALQEAIQEGGDTNFRGLLARLQELVRGCSVPVYVKECGGGIAPELVGRLAEAGAAYVDISGADGTSWAAVEGRLSDDPSLGELFRDFGLPTAWILERLTPEQAGGSKIVASGGIRDGLQAAQALALGADYVCLARPFLLGAAQSAQAAISVGERLKRELRTAMFLVGATRLEALDRACFLEPPGTGGAVAARP